MIRRVRADVIEPMALVALLALTAALGTILLWRNAERRSVDQLHVVEVPETSGVPAGFARRALDLSPGGPIDLETLRDAIERATRRRILIHEAFLKAESPDWPPSFDAVNGPIKTVGEGLRRIGVQFSSSSDVWSAPAWTATDDRIVVAPSDRLFAVGRHVAFYDVRKLLERMVRMEPADRSSSMGSAQPPVGGSFGNGITGNVAVSCFPRRGYRPSGSYADAADDTIDLIQETIEPDLWHANGGLVASIRHYSGLLIVNAPPRIHREVEAVLRALEYQLQFD